VDWVKAFFDRKFPNYSTRPSAKFPNYGYGEPGAPLSFPPLNTETLGAPWNMGISSQNIFKWYRGQNKDNYFSSETQFRAFQNAALGSDPNLTEKGWYQFPDNHPIYVETYVASNPNVEHNGDEYYTSVSQIGNKVQLNYSTNPTGQPIISEWTSTFKLLYMYDIWNQ
jgi:hypothetical protein